MAGICVTVIVVAGAVYFGTDLFRQPAGEKSIAVTGLPASQDINLPPAQEREEKRNSGAAVNGNLALPQHSREAQGSPPAASVRPPAAVSPKPADKTDGVEPSRKSQSPHDGQDAQPSGRSATKPVTASRRAGAGTYQTTRSATVFESASASSQVIANIPSGTRVDVVSAKGEWLEVHSRRGNPPGFIRREDAALVDKTE
jgi:hypothetical protein